MKQKWAFISLLAASLLLTACSKQDETPKSKVTEDASAVVVPKEQQAAIDALDQPILDEKNKDVPIEVANAPAEAATIHEENLATK